MNVYVPEELLKNPREPVIIVSVVLIKLNRLFNICFFLLLMGVILAFGVIIPLTKNVLNTNHTSMLTNI